MTARRAGKVRAPHEPVHAKRWTVEAGERGQLFATAAPSQVGALLMGQQSGDRLNRVACGCGSRGGGPGYASSSDGRLRVRRGGVALSALALSLVHFLVAVRCVLLELAVSLASLRGRQSARPDPGNRRRRLRRTNGRSLTKTQLVGTSDVHAVACLRTASGALP